MVTSSAAKFLHWGSEDSDLFGIGNVALDTTVVTIGTTIDAPTGTVLTFSSTTGLAAGNFVIGYVTVLPTSGDTPSGGVLPFASTSGLLVNMTVNGTNIPANTHITSLTTTTVTLNNSVSGDVPNATNITFNAAAANLPSNTWISGLTSTTVTLNQAISGDIPANTFFTFYNHFDPFVSYGLLVNTPSSGQLANFWRTVGQFNSQALCVSANMWSNGVPGFIVQGPGNTFLIRFLDHNGVPLLTITNPGNTIGPAGPWMVAQVAVNGALLQLGNQFVGIQANVKQRVTLYYNPTGGVIQVRVNGGLVYQYTGYTPPNNFEGYDLGNATTSQGTGDTVWSSIVAANFDCTSIVMAKVYITGAGATSDWNGDASGDTINELQMNITDGIDSGTPNAIELFTTLTALPGGSWEIMGLGIAAFTSAAQIGFTADTSGDTASGATIPFSNTSGMTVGQTVTGPEIPVGSVIVSIVVNTSITLNNSVLADLPSGSTLNFLPPQHMQTAVRIGGVNYFSPTLEQNLDGSGNIVDISPSLDRVAYIFPNSPATSQPFTSTEIASLQIGLKAIN